MNETIKGILNRRETILSEMSEHSKALAKLLDVKDPAWVTELEKYYTARGALLEADKELAAALRDLDAAA
jgi:hypothetical protein